METRQVSSRKKKPSNSQMELALCLHELSNHAFPKPELKNNSDYVTLDVQTGNHKNAVSILRKSVTFQVSDWKRKEEARLLQEKGLLQAEARESNRKRLEFVDLTLSDVTQNEAFFRELLAEAKQAAEMRQK